MKPIPARELPHSATLLVASAVDAWQHKTDTTINLTHVRIEPSHKQVLTKDNTQITLSALLFFDVVHSQPIGTNLSELQQQAETAGGDMRVVFGGETHRVETVKALYWRGDIHHWEVGLV